MITFKSKFDILSIAPYEEVVNFFRGNIQAVTFDSRNVPPSSIFFALEGAHADGHNFVLEALQKGAEVAVVKKVLPEFKNISNKTILQVDSPLKFMSIMAKEYRKYFNADVVGITGTTGKTTTKYLIAHLLEKKFKTLAAPESYNNLLGLSYTILNYTDHQKVVLELGINHPNEMDELVEIARPNIAIITNISPVHLEGMKNVFQIFNEKAKIIRYAQKVIINADAFLLNSISHTNTIRVGRCKNCDYKATLVQKTLNKISFTINNEFFEFPTYSAINIYPALFAYAVGKEFSMNYYEVFEAFLSFSVPKMRTQLLVKNDKLIFVDCYNANPQSMIASITEFVEISSAKRVFILGEMLELGEYSDFYHKKVANFLRKFEGKKVLVGERFKAGAEFLAKFDTFYLYFPSLKELLDNFNKIKESDYKFYLLKASRAVGLEKIIEYL
jgi:UDP-N-acetylmuramoyl-tripeptide--D-alanyl-D-alanine ligase